MFATLFASVALPAPRPRPGAGGAVEPEPVHYPLPQPVDGDAAGSLYLHVPNRRVELRAPVLSGQCSAVELDGVDARRQGLVCAGSYLRSGYRLLAAVTGLP